MALKGMEICKTRAAAMAHARGCANDFRTPKALREAIRAQDAEDEIEEGIAQFKADANSIEADILDWVKGW